MFGWDEGALLRVFGPISFVGENLPVPAPGYCVHLGTWVDLDSLCPVFLW